MTPTPVLIVEDEDNVAFVIGEALGAAGFAVVNAASGAEGLDLALRGDFELMVLDVSLPDIDGFSVCRRLRTTGSDLPVVFLTARDSTQDRVNGLTIGGDDYLTKPFSVDELVARVRVVLRRAGKLSGGPVLRCGGVALDDLAHRVTCAGAEVELSPTEYKLLRFLLQNKGRVLSRRQILDHVWDYDFEGEPTVVETFISTLRKKVDFRERRLIQTVRGIGYRLAER